MWTRMWRAFWVAMREPVKRYAPSSTLVVRVDVDCEDAMLKLTALAQKAARLRAETDDLKWLQ
jgi:hypothetical protein